MTAVRTPLRAPARRSSAPAAAPRRTEGRPKLAVAPTPEALRPRRALWVVGVVALLVAVLVVMASQALLVQSQDRLDDLQRSMTEQEAIAERQQLQLAELQSPERVVAAATERLGMVPPTDVVHLRSDPTDDGAIAVAPAYPDPATTAADPAEAPGATADADAPSAGTSPSAAAEELAAGDRPAAAGG